MCGQDWFPSSISRWIDYQHELFLSAFFIFFLSNFILSSGIFFPNRLSIWYRHWFDWWLHLPPPASLWPETFPSFLAARTLWFSRVFSLSLSLMWLNFLNSPRSSQIGAARLAGAWEGGGGLSPVVMSRIITVSLCIFHIIARRFLDTIALLSPLERLSLFGCLLFLRERVVSEPVVRISRALPTRYTLTR